MIQMSTKERGHVMWLFSGNLSKPDKLPLISGNLSKPDKLPGDLLYPVVIYFHGLPITKFASIAMDSQLPSLHLHFALAQTIYH